eukprot:1165027-Pyramimonas_sp.AAC.1
MELLTKKAKSDGKPLTPTISEPNVSWLPHRGACKASYFDRTKQKWSVKTAKVPYNADHQAFQEAVDRAAADAQAFYEKYH